MKLDTAESVTSKIKIAQPREHRGKICLWADLSVNDVDELFFSWSSPSTVRDLLSKIFAIDASSEKAAILLDLYFYTLQFAKENQFTTEQTSAFFSMVKQTHEICIETPFDNFDLCFKHFKEQLLCHAVRRPPFSLDLYSTEQVRLISEYVINTYFRHYKMYKYAYTPMVRLDLTLKYTGMPVTPPESEAGDVTGLGDEDEGSQMPEAAGGEGAQAPEQPEQEESTAAKELRSMIRQHLETEIKKLRSSVDDQLKVTEDNLSQKLNMAEGGTKGSKASRSSPKGKKK